MMHAMNTQWIEGDLEWTCYIPEYFDTDAIEMLIAPIDRFTEINCHSYGVDYDPDMAYSLFLVFDKPVDEFVLISLHPDSLDAAKAGNRYIESLAVRP